MKTKDDYLKDKDFCNIIDMYAEKPYKNEKYTTNVGEGHFPQKTYRTINIYHKDSIFLLGQVELDITNKIATIYKQHNYEASKAIAQYYADHYGYEVRIR